MIDFKDSHISNCIVHIIGNKYKEEHLQLSKEELILTENSSPHLIEFFFRHFKNRSRVYRFKHDIDLKMNEVYTCVDNIFEGEEFIKNSSNIAKHLYNSTNHFAIKSGDLFIAKIDEIIFEDVICKGIGIFKSEQKDEFLKIIINNKKNDLIVEKGINTHKLDKGCIILNEDYHTGFKIFTFENHNSDTEYWRNDFLSITDTQDKYTQTDNFINICKEYSNSYVKESYGKQEQVNFVNSSLDYISSVDSINIGDFENTLFKNESDKFEFQKIANQLSESKEIVLQEEFEVAKNIVNIQKKKFKNEIKLDTNISIKIENIDPNILHNYIEKGYDQNKNMSFYKVYFNHER